MIINRFYVRYCQYSFTHSIIYNVELRLSSCLRKLFVPEQFPMANYLWLTFLVTQKSQNMWRSTRERSWSARVGESPGLFRNPSTHVGYFGCPVIPTIKAIHTHFFFMNSVTKSAFIGAFSQTNLFLLINGIIIWVNIGGFWGRCAGRIILLYIFMFTRNYFEISAECHALVLIQLQRRTF